MNALPGDVNEALDEVIEQYGTVEAFSRAFCITPQAVSNWRARGRIPAKQAVRIQRETGIEMSRLAPYFFDAA